MSTRTVLDGTVRRATVGTSLARDMTPGHFFKQKLCFEVRT
jgi:hypothetical protein